VIALLGEQALAAERTLPAAVHAYYASGSGDEVAAGEAEAAWRRYRFRPRVLRDVTTVDLGCTLLGSRLAMPIGIAPTAFHRLAHEEAEVATIGAAGAAGALMVVSTRASLPFEEIASAATAPWWFQVYVMRDRELTLALALRAAAAGAAALVLTADTPFVGVKPRVDGVRIAIPDDDFLINLSRHLAADVDHASATAQDPAVTFDDIAWLAEASGLPVVVKGVLRGDDAVRCLDAGAAAVVVSNHGGRQLSRALPTALALVDVVAAVAGRAPVLVDGGLRSGSDVLAALALGADAAFVGRPVLWALAVGGRPGVEACLSALRGDLAHCMALAGASDLGALDPELVVDLGALPTTAPRAGVPGDRG
jgi:4-hydroxymandelate oxidase